MSLSKLLKLLEETNIAESLEEDELKDIGVRVCERFQEDWDSMSEWMDVVDEGMKLMKQEFKGRSTPWEGASNYKSPLLTEASVTFGDKSSLEIMRSRNLVKTDIIGKDPEGRKKALSERVTEAMNYQINYQMKDWRKHQKRLLYTLPNQGCMFKKTYFCPTKGNNVSDIIQYPNFAVNQATTDMESCRSFTQILDVDLNGAIERMAAGTWRDVELYPEDADGDEGSNEKSGTGSAQENSDRFLEQYCRADLDGDGYEEPYIITVHEQSNTVLRIVPLFAPSSIYVQDERELTKSLVMITKDRAIREMEAALPAFMESGQPVKHEEEASLKGLTLVRIDPVQQITKYGFIPAPDGTFLDLGYSHLIGAITQAVNATTNQLVDAGTLANAGGGFLAKGFRKKMGPLRTKIGEWVSTEVTAQHLQSSMMPNPSREPSQTLFALNEKLEQQGRGFSAAVDASGQIQSNTAPTTALAMVQESLIGTSALMGRVLDSMSDEFQALFILNRRFFDPETYKMILDDQEADSAVDFNSEELDIIPTASPEMSSSLQRIQLATVQLDQWQTVLQMGGNPIPIVRNYFEAIGSQNIDQIFPEGDAAQTEQEKQQLEAMRAQQEQANQLAQAQLEAQQLQIELTKEQLALMGREQDRLDRTAEINGEETRSKIDINIQKLEDVRAGIEKTLADTTLTLEQAETESLNNQITTYTATLESLTQSRDAIDRMNPKTTDFDFDMATGELVARG
jgi:chaperonin GroES